MKLSEIKSGLLGSMGVKGKDSAAIIRRLIVENFRVQWRRYAVAIILMMMVAGSTSASAWIISYVVNKIFIEKNISLLVPLSLSILVLFVVKGFSNYGQEVVMGRIGNRMVAESQLRVYSHLLKFGLDYFTAKPSSHIINTVSAGAHSARDVVNTMVVSFGRDLLTLAGLAAVMIVKAPLLSVIAFVIAPIAILGMNRLVKRVRAVVLAEFGMTTRVVQLIQETVQGARVVKAFNLGPHMQAQMTDAVRGIEARANKIIRLKAGSAPLMETLGGVSICAVTLYSGWATIVGANSPGDFMSFITAFLLAYEPAKRLARLHVNLESSLVGARMMFALLATQPGKTETTGDRPLSFGAGIIEFRNVHFGYKTSRLVLKDISFRIEKNMRAALVGPSGAGKTTILTLIPRLYEVGSGSITIDGEDVRNVSAESIRQRIALVSQDTYLFDGTVRDNIRLGRLDATDPDIEKAARDAHAHDFIAALSRGYDTRIGENGVRLSGGQRQRIAIARAVIKGAPIILLDEATSSLDSESEKQVQLALDELMQGRTTIVIAHRLSTILSADKILVIDDGVVVEEGTHRDLLASSGVYQRLYNLQFGPGHVVRLGSTETIQEPVEP